VSVTSPVSCTYSTVLLLFRTSHSLSSKESTSLHFTLFFFLTLHVASNPSTYSPFSFFILSSSSSHVLHASDSFSSFFFFSCSSFYFPEPLPPPSPSSSFSGYPHLVISRLIRLPSIYVSEICFCQSCRHQAGTCVSIRRSFCPPNLRPVVM